MSEEFEKLIDVINKDISHHQTWRVINATLYVLLTLAFVICGISATIFAGEGLNEYTAWLAGSSTATGTLERSLRIRERWVDHLKRYTELRNIRTRLSINTYKNVSTAIKDYESISLDYAQNIPMDGRDEINGNVNK